MQKLLRVMSLTLGFCCLSWVLWKQAQPPAIAVVRSAVVVEGYLGMKEARAAYQQKAEQWNKELDSMQHRLRHAEGLYAQSDAAANEKKGYPTQAVLTAQRQQLESYQVSLEQVASREESKAVQGALNQINGFIQGYAKERGFQVVLGTTEAGNVLYAQEAIDITDEVLNALNKQYK